MNESINVLGLCGSPVKDSNAAAFLDQALAEVAGEGVTIWKFHLAGRNVSPCQHCNWCLRKQTLDKICRLEDDLAELYPLVLVADAIMVASPVYLGRLSGPLACLLDRLRALLYGRHYAGSLKHKVGAGLAVGWYRNSGLETTLLSLHLAFLTFQMVIAAPGSGATFGGVGVTSLQGSGRFDPQDRHHVLKDDFGLETARATARAAVELARIVKAGRQSLRT